MAEQSYIEGARYRVRLSKRIEVDPFVYRPRQRNLEMTGAMLNRIVDQGDGDKIASAERIKQ